jgi:hypothetical protein
MFQSMYTALFTVSCRYFVGSCDDGVKFYDFETGQVRFSLLCHLHLLCTQLLHSWSELFSCYCDCVKFASPIGMPVEKGAYYLLTRGVELLKDDNSNRSTILYQLMT